MPPIRLSGFAPDPLLSALPGAQLYVVGGAVRDELLGTVSHDRDWVLVGANAEQLIELGFTPVGADFPVFIHPKTKDEVALARTERKNGKGYKGFVFHASPEVTLEEDLQRRDFTINAMAMSQDGRLIDPYGGQSDLSSKRMRHVSDAFVEDPLRVLRLARFLARFVDFTVHESTLALCRELVAQGELAHLVPERVGAEMSRGLGEAAPERMFGLLGDVQALGSMAGGALLAEMASKAPWVSLRRLQHADERWALALGMTLNVEQISELADAVRLPVATRDLGVVVARVQHVYQGDVVNHEEFLNLVAAVDIYRKVDRLRQALSLITRVSGSNEWLRLLTLACKEVMDGTFKASLRVHMQQHDAQVVEFGAQTVVEQFKRQWATQILDTMQH